MASPLKRCHFCRRPFRPDPRAASRQYACPDESCQRQRKQAKQQAWVIAHPGYFQGLYAKKRAWFAAHVGYLAEYRRQHPVVAAQHREEERKRRRRARQGVLPPSVDIQVEIPPQPTVQTEIASSPLPSPRQSPADADVDIQAEMIAQSPILLGLIDKLQGVESVDIPSHIDLSAEACYKLGLRVRASWLASRSASHG
jgi:hypothetical protein